MKGDRLDAAAEEWARARVAAAAGALVREKAVVRGLDLPLREGLSLEARLAAVLLDDAT